MPAYGFMIEDGEKPVETYRLELADLDAARVEAARVLGALIQHEHDRFWRTTDFKVSVLDSMDRLLLELRASADQATSEVTG